MIDELVKLRRLLHSQPELSGKEERTAHQILTFLEEYSPDRLVTEIGGFGLAAIYNGKAPGPRILIRCELDALPIPETIKLPYESGSPGIAHKCGHDGHMAIIAGVAMQLYKHPPAKGSTVLLFQPSEETGEGAELVLGDQKFKEIEPDYVFALHNLPGFKMGRVILSDGLFASASSGLAVYLQGDTSHAAEPNSGRSPALAVAQLIQAISCVPQFYTALHETAQATIIHAELGEIAFGTSPGRASVMATLRSHSEKTMDLLVEKSTEFAKRIAATYDLEVEVDLMQPFPPTVNDSEATEIIRQSAHGLDMETEVLAVPFGWSEDFGHFTSRYKGALFGLGAGESQPALHHPEYDFPEDLIEPGVKLFIKVIRSLTG